jgi:hypothetical protein
LQTTPLKSWPNSTRPANIRRWVSRRRGAACANQTSGRQCGPTSERSTPTVNSMPWRIGTGRRTLISTLTIALPSCSSTLRLSASLCSRMWRISEFSASRTVASSPTSSPTGPSTDSVRLDRQALRQTRSACDCGAGAGLPAAALMTD